jgi:hypothetical protein
MRRILLSCLLVAVMLAPRASVAQQGPLLGQQQAHARAVQFLKGDPYGRTSADVSRNIKGQSLFVDGRDDACEIDYRKRPAWRFHVVVDRTGSSEKIEGYLLLDARSGKMICAGLPFLD